MPSLRARLTRAEHALRDAPPPPRSESSPVYEAFLARFRTLSDAEKAAFRVRLLARINARPR